jgi:hypothetical protein
VLLKQSKISEFAAAWWIGRLWFELPKIKEAFPPLASKVAKKLPTQTQLQHFPWDVRTIKIVSSWSSKAYQQKWDSEVTKMNAQRAMDHLVRGDESNNHRGIHPHNQIQVFSNSIQHHTLTQI